MSLTPSGTKEKDTPKERSSLPREGAKRPRHAVRPCSGPRCAFCRHGDATDLRWWSAPATGEAAEEHKNSRSRGPIPATPASVPARCSVAIDVASLVGADTTDRPRPGGAPPRSTLPTQRRPRQRIVRHEARDRVRVKAATPPTSLLWA